MRIKLTVNGAENTLEVEPRTTLLDCLRIISVSKERMRVVKARRVRCLHGPV
jgi:aerobic-type carbon monoxide dehydrogenase small subunit (CoxS/CutS family)